MDDPLNNQSELGVTSRRLARRLLTIGENRLELLMVEVHEERQRLLQALLFSVAAGTFALLAGMAITLAVGVLTRDRSPVLALLALTIVYLGIAVVFYRRLLALQRQWKILPATLDQLKKDCACLEQIIN